MESTEIFPNYYSRTDDNDKIHQIQCRFPQMKPMIAYAVTGMISATSPEGPRVSPLDWWNEVRKYPKPRVVVLHDIDNPVVGSFWGEVNANIHRALACVGTKIQIPNKYQ